MMSNQFLIKHRSSGKFLHPRTGGANANVPNGDPVVLHDGIHPWMYWTFEQVEKHWGYITHVSSGKRFHPREQHSNPDNGTEVVLRGGRHWGALFAMDAVNDHIIHKSGKNIRPKDRPANGTKMVIWAGTQDHMRFQFVSLDDSNKEVLVYGVPTLAGVWKLINVVKNPLAVHVSEITVTVGKSSDESTTGSIKYKWEVSAGLNIEIFQGSVSSSLEAALEKTSSSTWSTETTSKKPITVSPGQTVATWQYIFVVTQNESVGIFSSNLLADTDSESKEPTDMQTYTL